MKLYSIIYYLMLATGFLFLSPATSAQQNVRPFYNDRVPVTPEAAGIIKALQYPVGYNTGVPEISIPLYELKSRGITLPFTLNYHAGGFKAREVAGTTGLGWTLNSNFQISRELNGGDDFEKSAQSEYSGYFYNNYGITDENNPDYSANDVTHRYQMFKGEIDAQPDRFYYNILGKSGSFVLSKTRNNRIFLPIPYNGISITCIPVAGSDKCVEFRIIDTDGTVYDFKLAEITQIQNSADFYVSAHESAWKCTSITAADRTETIDYSYIQLPTLYSSVEEDYVELYEDKNGNGAQGKSWINGGTVFADKVKEKASNDYAQVMRKFSFFNLSVPRAINHNRGLDAGLVMYSMDTNAPWGYSADTFNQNFTPFIHSSTIQTRYAISQVSASNQTLYFYYTPEKFLQLIELHDSQRNKIRDFYFDQTQLGTYESKEHTNRTNYLDAIRIIEGTGLKKALTYSFEYTSKHAFANYTKGGNYWGGLNMYTTDRSSQTRISMPPLILSTRYYRSNSFNDYIDNFPIWLGSGTDPLDTRNVPELHYSLAGQLKKITYPTGGYTEFDFGMNYGHRPDSYDPVPAGGLRINEIRHFDADGILQNKKVYKYGDFQYSVGFGSFNGISYYSCNATAYPLFHKQEVEYIINPSLKNNMFSYTRRDIVESKTTYQSTIVEGMNFSSGFPVYYDKVTEFDYSATGENGKKEFLYTAPDVFGYQASRRIGTTNLLFFDENWRHGQLEHENTYRSLGNGRYQLIHSIDYEYRMDFASRRSFTAMPYQSRIFMGVYENGDGYQHSELCDTYDMQYIGSGVELYPFYISSGKVFPLKKTEKSYDGGQESVIVSQYSYDSYFQPKETITTYPDGSQERETVSYSTSRNFVGIPVEKKRYAIEKPGAVWINIEGTLRDFRSQNPAQVENVYALAPGGSYYLKAHFDYDAQNNVVTETMNDAPNVVYLWGYDNQYPVAEIRNSDYATVCAALGENVITALQFSSDPNYIRQCMSELRIHPTMAKAQVRSFIHLPLLGVSEITEANGLTSKYSYDKLGRLKGITDPTGFQGTYYYYNYLR